MNGPRATVFGGEAELTPDGRTYLITIAVSDELAPEVLDGRWIDCRRISFKPAPEGRWVLVIDASEVAA